MSITTLSRNEKDGAKNCKRLTKRFLRYAFVQKKILASDLLELEGRRRGSNWKIMLRKYKKMRTKNHVIHHNKKVKEIEKF